MLSQPSDIDAMEYNIKSLLNNNKLLKSISENGYKSVLQFNWEKSVKKFEKILMQ